jgi:predicted nucleic acid-binding protein
LRGNQKIVSVLQKLFDDGLFVSIISVAELCEGVYASTNPKHKMALDDFLSGVVVLGIDLDVCKTFGKLRHELRKRGDIIGDFDLLIAATALSNNLTILTNNVRHFNRLEFSQRRTFYSLVSTSI